MRDKFFSQFFSLLGKYVAISNNVKAYFLLGIGLLVVVILLVVNLGHTSTLTHRLDDNVTSQLKNRVANVATWCGAINETRDYLREYNTQTLKQTEKQVGIINKALEGKSSLTSEQVVFLRLYLDSVVALERAVPQVLTLKPFTLKDLNCPTLEKKTQASSKPKHPTK